MIGVYCVDCDETVTDAQHNSHKLHIVPRAWGNELATIEEIERARDEYANDVINIDDDALASRYEGGLWVQAWVDLED